MQKFDVLIVGAGMVGLTLAIALRQNTSLNIAIADMSPPIALGDEPDVRVSAINIASQTIFENLGVWALIESSGSQPYQQMHIWDKENVGSLDFSINDIKSTTRTEQLGWIIENSVIRQALWDKAQQDEGIHFFTENPLLSLAVGESEVFASFETNDAPQSPLMAKLVVGADGANSWVRQQMDMAMIFRDYDHHAIVATVKCSQGHKNTAWQVFLPTGPLAFLPLHSRKGHGINNKSKNSQVSDNQENDLCSIVYSTSPEGAKRLIALEPADFAKELTVASDGKLGIIKLVSNRYTYPLTMRLVQDFVKERVVLIGDAAHTIHPLAGQGVNLGLLDAASLAQTLSATGSNLAEQKSLKLFARWRKTEASEMIAAMEAIKQAYTPQHSIFKLVRGIGMSLLNNTQLIKKIMIEQALGIKNDLPILATKEKQ